MVQVNFGAKPFVFDLEVRGEGGRGRVEGCLVHASIQ